MSEITPVPPSLPLPNVHKVEREPEHNKQRPKQQQPKKPSSQEHNDGMPAQHIDEIV